MERKGIVQVYTGEGKGKTTAALGQALRAVGHGWKVLIIQFLKSRLSGEIKAAKNIPNLTILQFGSGHFVNNKP
ncbi:MAG TPA: cob(I)yrinic acid a,c-diamide adenosyltransferase, partial [Candidatus Hypogeohydataceae bacterium YC41]